MPTITSAEKARREAIARAAALQSPPSYNPITGRMTVTAEDIQGLQNLAPAETVGINAPIDEKAMSVMQPTMNRATTMDWGYGTAPYGLPGVPASPYGSTTLQSVMNEPDAFQPVTRTGNVLTTNPRTTPEQQTAYNSSLAFGMGNINAGQPQQFSRATDFLSTNPAAYGKPSWAAKAVGTINDMQNAQLVGRGLNAHVVGAVPGNPLASPITGVDLAPGAYSMHPEFGVGVPATTPQTANMAPGQMYGGPIASSAGMAQIGANRFGVAPPSAPTPVDQQVGSFIAGLPGRAVDATLAAPGQAVDLANQGLQSLGLASRPTPPASPPAAPLNMGAMPAPGVAGVPSISLPTAAAPQVSPIGLYGGPPVGAVNNPAFGPPGQYGQMDPYSVGLQSLSPTAEMGLGAPEDNVALGQMGVAPVAATGDVNTPINPEFARIEQAMNTPDLGVPPAVAGMRAAMAARAGLGPITSPLAQPTPVGTPINPAVPASPLVAGLDPYAAAPAVPANPLTGAPVPSFASAPPAAPQPATPATLQGVTPVAGSVPTPRAAPLPQTYGGVPTPPTRPAGPFPQQYASPLPTANPLQNMDAFNPVSPPDFSFGFGPAQTINPAGDISVQSMGPGYAGPLGINTGGISGLGGLIGTNPAASPIGVNPASTSALQALGGQYGSAMNNVGAPAASPAQMNYGGYTGAYGPTSGYGFGGMPTGVAPGYTGGGTGDIGLGGFGPGGYGGLAGAYGGGGGYSDGGYGGGYGGGSYGGGSYGGGSYGGESGSGDGGYGAEGYGGEGYGGQGPDPDAGSFW